MQSISKTFSLALVLAQSHGGHDSSGSTWAASRPVTPFNSLVQLETENGIPRNPFINAGALVVTDRLQTLTGDASTSMLHFLREESGNAGPRLRPGGRRLRGRPRRPQCRARPFHGVLRQSRQPGPSVLEHYFRQCSIETSCGDLALAAGFLARHGLRADGTRLLTPRQAKQINAVMLTCGTYDAAGRVRLPGRAARQERCRRRHHRRGPRPLHAVRMEPRTRRPRQLRGGRRGPGPLHDADRTVGVLTRPRGFTGPGTGPGCRCGRRPAGASWA